MKRVHSAHAYSDERIERCFWTEAVPDKVLSRPALSGSLKADVAIIGAGFTGLSAALRLARSGVDVVVLDTRFPGWGASGRNGGFCCLGGSKLADAKLDRAYGKRARLDWRMAERRAVELVAALIAANGTDADTHSSGETALAHKPGRLASDHDIAACEENYGVTPKLLYGEDLKRNGLNGPFHGAMTIPLGFALHPRKFLLGLLRACEAAGTRVFGDSPVSGLHKVAGGYRLATACGEVNCTKVVLATNGYSSDDLPGWMAARYLPVQSSILVTRELSASELDDAGWTSRQMAYDTRKLLHYFRLMPDNRLLFGMRGGLLSTSRAEARSKGTIRRDFEAMFPAWREVETPYYWSGMVCLSPRLVPFCGPVHGMPDLFAGFAYHGNGVAMGTYCGAHLAERMLGNIDKHPLPEFVSRPPGRFPLGRWRNALMWPAYFLAGLADL